METKTSSLHMQIESRFGSCTSATLFYGALVSGVVNFWNHLETWITRFKKDLTAQSGGDTSKAHKDSICKLVCWMVHAMFKEMLKRRQWGCSIPVFTTGTDITEALLQQKCSTIL